MPTHKLCPFLTRTITLHNEKAGYYTVPVGINKIADNDVTFTDFRPCLEEDCMMYDNLSKKCLYKNR